METRVKNSRIFKIKNNDFEYELEITEKGFTLWVLEDNEKRIMHWLIDASMLKETNIIDLAKRDRTWEIGLKEHKHPYFKRFRVEKCKSKS